MVQIAALHVFPVKGLQGIARQSALVEPWGLADDRRWMVVDRDGRFLTQRQHPIMATIRVDVEDEGIVLTVPAKPPLSVARPRPEDGSRTVTVWQDRVPAHDAGDPAAALLGAALGLPCRLVFMAEPRTARPVDPDYAQAGDCVSFADGFPLLLASHASLDDLNARLAQPLPMSRFRPNLVVDGDGAWAEDGWTRLRIGDVLFDSVKPCARCVVTTIDQRTGGKSDDGEPIRTLQRFRRDAGGRVNFGHNLIPRGAGRIQVGDRVDILG